MKYTAIGLLSFPIIFGLMPAYGVLLAGLIAGLLCCALWSIAWRVEFGSWMFWKDKTNG